jgi:hypothetical protein
MHSTSQDTKVEHKVGAVLHKPLPDHRAALLALLLRFISELSFWLQPTYLLAHTAPFDSLGFFYFVLKTPWESSIQLPAVPNN